MAIARGVRFILLFMIAAVIVSMTGVALSYFLLTRGPAVQSDSVLWLRIPANLGEQAPDDVFGLFGRRDTVGSVVTALRKAKVDDRVSAVVVVPPFAPVLWGTVQEIRDAVVDFRESGKPIVAHLEFGMGQAYYLATACDRIFMSPTSPLMLVGVSSYELFFRGTLEKVGIEADMLAAGDYKTAINTYTESAFTPEHREASEALSRDFYEQLIDGIAEGRDMTRGRVREIIDQGPFVAADAVSLGLVDDLAYEDELLDRLASDDEPVQLDFATYRRVDPESLGLDTGPRIAVVYAEGLINFGSSTPDFPGSTPLVGFAHHDRGDSRRARRSVDRGDRPPDRQPRGRGDRRGHHLARAAAGARAEAAGRVDGRRGGLGRLLHCRPRARHRGATWHADRFDRGVQRQVRRRRRLREAGRGSRRGHLRRAGRHLLAGGIASATPPAP